MLQLYTGLRGCFAFGSCAREKSQDVGLNTQELIWHPSTKLMQIPCLQRWTKWPEALNKLYSGPVSLFKISKLDAMCWDKTKSLKEKKKHPNKKNFVKYEQKRERETLSKKQKDHINR